MNEDDRDEIDRRLAELEARIAKLEHPEHSAPRKAARKRAQQPELSGITEGKDSTRVPTTPQSKRIADIFHRRHTTPWSEKEIKAYKKLGKIPEDTLSAVEAYYKSDAQFLRRDLFTFLNNFSGEVDRAHAWQKEATSQRRPIFEA